MTNRVLEDTIVELAFNSVQEDRPESVKESIVAMFAALGRHVSLMAVVYGLDTDEIGNVFDFTRDGFSKSVSELREQFNLIEDGELTSENQTLN